MGLRISFIIVKFFDMLRNQVKNNLIVSWVYIAALNIRIDFQLAQNYTFTRQSVLPGIVNTVVKMTSMAYSSTTWG